MKTILVPIDFSPDTRYIVAEAVELAQAMKARVMILHSVPPPAIIASELAPMVDTALLVTADVEKAAERHLRRMQREWSQRYAVPIEAVMMNGYPVPNIVEQANALPADLIVMGSHGHTAIYDLVMGTTTSGVLKRSHCPVLIVPARKKDPSAPVRRAHPRVHAGRVLPRRIVPRRPREPAVFVPSHPVPPSTHS